MKPIDPAKLNDTQKDDLIRRLFVENAELRAENAELKAQILQLQATVQTLLERLNLNSSNSHTPPSSDRPERKPKADKRKKRNGRRTKKRDAHLLLASYYPLIRWTIPNKSSP